MTCGAASQPNLREKCLVALGCSGRPGHEIFIPSLPPESFKVGPDILDQGRMIIVIS
jgi:hypothetical protein